MDTNTSNPNDGMSLRDRIRNAVLDSSADDILVEVFGTRIAIRPPEMKELIQYRDWQDDEYLMARAIINNCYVPDSNDKVFEEADLEVLGTLRFSADMKKLTAAINKVLGDDSALTKAIEDNTKSTTA